MKNAHPAPEEQEERHEEFQEVVAECLKVMEPPRRPVQVVGHRVGHWLGLWGQKEASELPTLADEGGTALAMKKPSICSLALCICNWPSPSGLEDFRGQAIFEAKQVFFLVLF